MKFFSAICAFCILNCSFILSQSPNLTAEFDSRKKTVLLKWQNTSVHVSAFTVQRSNDNKNWSDRFTLEAPQFSKKKIEKYTDPHPDPARNYYRLKMLMRSGKPEYSPSIMVIIGNPVNSWVMYPVPVREVINLQYNGSEAITGVVNILITNMHGNVLSRRRFSSLGRIIQIPVDNLGRGTYDIRIMINDAIVWNQRFVK